MPEIFLMFNCWLFKVDYQQVFTLVIVETAFVDEDRFLLSADGVTNRYPIHLVFLINMVKQSANFIVDYRFPLPFRSARHTPHG